MSYNWTLPNIRRQDAPKPKPRSQQVKCPHKRAANIINPLAGWSWVCLDCGIKTR